jgi:hypothetical protein
MTIIPMKQPGFDHCLHALRIGAEYEAKVQCKL